MNPIPMRRHRQQLSQQQSINLLESSTSGTLSLNQPDGFPYQVPLSYVYTDGKLYFHCAQSGYKLDLLHQDDRAGFCVIAQDRICPERYTTFYQSVVLRGRVRIVEQPDEKMDACVNCALAMSRWTARRATSRPSTRNGPRCVSSALKSNR